MSAPPYRPHSSQGTARPELLKQLLSTTERVVQTVDSVEYGEHCQPGRAVIL